MPNCLIKQPAGLGDIIFCQKIANIFMHNDYEIWWPVIDQYYDAVQEHMAHTGIRYCKQSDDFPLKECFYSSTKVPTRYTSTNDVYLPLQYADLKYPDESIMYSKYKLVGMDFSDWREHVSIKRNKEKEHYLYYDVLGLEDNFQYCLVNRFFGSPPDILERGGIQTPKDIQAIEMHMLGFDTIFDWSYVIEQATEIHTVETVFCYLMEKLDLKARRKVIYSRNKPDRGFDYIKDIYSNDWEYIL